MRILYGLSIGATCLSLGRPPDAPDIDIEEVEASAEWDKLCEMDAQAYAAVAGLSYTPANRKVPGRTVDVSEWYRVDSEWKPSPFMLNWRHLHIMVDLMFEAADPAEPMSEVISFSFDYSIKHKGMADLSGLLALLDTVPQNPVRVNMRLSEHGHYLVMLA